MRGIQRVGVDFADGLELAEYRERNRSFRVDLEGACGPRELARFKESSAAFRRALVAAAAAPSAIAGKGASDGPAHEYAERVLEVFGPVAAAAGTAAAADLLRDLVVLLPDRSARHCLHEALKALVMREAEASPAPPPLPPWRVRGTNAASRSESASARPREDLAKAAAAAPPDLPPEVADLPPASAFRDPEDRQPSFPLALGAVLAAISVAEDAGPPAGPRRRGSSAPSATWTSALSAHVASLEIHQLESLEAMRLQLSAFGGGEFAPVERLLTLRPQLLLKLNGRSSASGDLTRPWTEWKVAAVSAASTLGADERRRVQAYISLCLQHAEQRERTAGGGSSAAEFPSLRTSAVCGPLMPWEHDASRVAGGADSGLAGDTAGKRKGRQKKVLAAWG